MTSKPNPWVLLAGDIIRGFKVVGPYATQEEANVAHPISTGHIVQLISQTEFYANEPDPATVATGGVVERERDDYCCQCIEDMAGVDIVTYTALPFNTVASPKGTPGTLCMQCNFKLNFPY